MLGTNFFSAGRVGWWQKGYPQLGREAEIRKEKYAAGMRLGQFAVAGNTPVGTVPGAKSVQSSEIKDGQVGKEEEGRDQLPWAPTAEAVREGQPCCLAPSLTPASAPRTQLSNARGLGTNSSLFLTLQMCSGISSVRSFKYVHCI